MTELIEVFYHFIVEGPITSRYLRRTILEYPSLLLSPYRQDEGNTHLRSDRGDLLSEGLRDNFVFEAISFLQIPINPYF